MTKIEHFYTYLKISHNIWLNFLTRLHLDQEEPSEHLGVLSAILNLKFLKKSTVY